VVRGSQDAVIFMKTFDQFRAKRNEVYENLFSAKALCFTGLLIMPAFLFSPSASFRILLFLFFWFLAWLTGRKNNPLITILIIFGITLFNLIVPYGKVLFSIGAFNITEGAFWGGICRAVTLEGLVMLSRIAIRPDLKIPGVFGELIGETFRIFSAIMNQKNRITRKNIIGDIDKLMLELSENSGRTSSGVTQVLRTRPFGYAILAIVTALSWLPLAALILKKS
jgi:heptaprenyl diphosphate synthase